MNGLLHRCRDGVGCSEVTARLRAAELADREGFAEHAARLRQTAARWADVHRHGDDREPVS